ncbi:FGGY family carbohydrate kinase, partial [Staphylococcus capitis]|uniref:FGGY family carbohydrate kinase n=1 Tax=Staphylococcus capitis TaxID=29388 RepID=UPI0037096CB5
FPHSPSLQHDANEICTSLLSLIAQVINQNHIQSQQIQPIPITNQPQTTLLSHKNTPPPIYHPILSQSPQTQHISNQLKHQPYQQTFTHKTPLLLHPYFPPTKLKSILHNLHPPTHKPQNPHL